MTEGDNIEQANQGGKDIPPWLQPVPEEELEAAPLASKKLKIAIGAGAVVILSLFVAVILYLYEGASNVQPIHVTAPDAAIKQKPSEAGGMAVDHQDKVIFDQRDGTQPRPEVSLEAQQEQPVAEIPEEQAQERVSDPIADVIDNTEDAASETEAAPEVVQPAQSQPVAKAQPAVTQPAAAEVPENAYRVQLGAYGSQASAQRAWRTARGLFPAHIGGKSADYEDVQAGDRTLYRLRIGPFETRAEADQVCLALRAKEQACIVVNP
jgi:cell division septation protein DedD